MSLKHLLEELSRLPLEEKVYTPGTLRQWKIGTVQKQSDGSWKLHQASGRSTFSLGNPKGAQLHARSPVAPLMGGMRAPDPAVLAAIRTPIAPRIQPSFGDGVSMKNRGHLEQVEKDIEALPWEEAHIFNAKGERMHRLRGNATSVEIPDIPMDDMILTHNHPIGLALSTEDLQLAIFKNLGEIRAVSREHDGTYVHRLLRPAKGWPSIDTVAAVFSRDTERKLRKLLLDNLTPLLDKFLPDSRTGSAGRITFKQADYKFTEEYLAAHAHILKIPYVREKIS